MSKVAQRYHILLSGKLNNSGKFSHQIYVPFVPDEMIVKNVTYAVDISVDPEEHHITLILCNNLNSFLATLLDKTSTSPMSTFILNNKSINGTWSFECRLVNLTLSTISLGDYTIMLEFIKYKE